MDVARKGGKDDGQLAGHADGCARAIRRLSFDNDVELSRKSGQIWSFLIAEF